MRSDFTRLTTAMAVLLFAATLTAEAQQAGKVYSVPISLVGHFLGNPVNPLRVPMTKVNAALAVALLIAALNSYAMPAALLAAFVVSFSANRAMYASNVRALRLALVKSEALFLNQYSKDGLRLRRLATTSTQSGDPE